jgi:tetratricopeptide (TPR) repeat protein
MLFLTLVLGLLAADTAGLKIPDAPAATAQARSTNKTTATPASSENDPLEKEYEKILEQDEKALNEINRLIRESDAFAKQGAPTPAGVLAAKIDAQLDPIRKIYEDFLKKHPEYVDARLAYGSFLNEVGDTQEAITQWEKARELAPKNPSPWNNLANIYGHIGPVKKAFEYYEKAIELDPKEPVYFQNFATTVYLFRKDAMEMYRINEEQVFNKSLDLYKKAMALDPNNLELATDYAQSFYGIRPMRVDDAIAAWDHALTLAKNDVEKQGIYLHLARVELNSGKFEQAQKNLDQVTIADMQELKAKLQKNLDKKKTDATQPATPVPATPEPRPGQ